MATVNTPTFLTPTADGLLSNTHGANAAGDRILVSAQYRGPGGPSGIRVTGARTGMNNQALPAGQPIWESSWVGQPATSPLPVTAALGAQAAVNYFGRIYMLVPASATPMPNCIAGVLSAPVNGGNVGEWRWESPVSVVATNLFNEPYYIQDTIAPGAICYVSDWLYVLGQKGIYYAKVNADGSLGGIGIAGVASLGQWNNALTAGPFNVAAGAMMAPYQVSVTQFPGWVGKLIVVDPRAGGSLLYTFDVHDDGTVNSVSVMNSTMPFQRGYGGLHVDPYGGVYVIGGEDGAGGPQVTNYKLTCDLSTNTPGSWFLTVPFPVSARSRFGFAAQSERIAGDTDVFVAGGIATLGGPTQNTIYVISGSNLRSGGGAWTALSGSGFTARSNCAAAFTHWGGANHPRREQAGPPGWPQSTYPLRTDLTASATVPQRQLVVIGGTSTPVVEVTSASDFTRPWFSGPAPVLLGSDLGTGGVVTRNPDGTYTVTFAYADNTQGGFGLPKVLASLLNGDWLEIGLQFAASTTGDTSTPGNALIKIGQPPTLSSVLPAAGAISTGRPTGSFTYVQGAGGGPEAYWRLTVTLAGSVIFDTDLRPDLVNSADINVAPYLLSGSSYTITSTAASTDTPYPGSSASATATAVVTPSYTPPAAPT